MKCWDKSAEEVGGAAPLHPLPCGLAGRAPHSFLAPTLPRPSVCLSISSPGPSPCLRTSTSRMAPVKAFRPLLSSRGRGVLVWGLPRPAGWGFPSSEPMSSGFKNQKTRFVCVCVGAEETLRRLCSVSHVPHVSRVPWLGVCGLSSLCPRRGRSLPPQSGQLSMEASTTGPCSVLARPAWALGSSPG